MKTRLAKVVLGLGPLVSRPAYADGGLNAVDDLLKLLGLGCLAIVGAIVWGVWQGSRPPPPEE